MIFKIGDVLTSKDALTGRTHEYRVTKTTQKSVFFQCTKIGQIPVSGEVQKTRPNERGELWTKSNDRLCKA